MNVRIKLSQWEASLPNITEFVNRKISLYRDNPPEDATPQRNIERQPLIHIDHQDYLRERAIAEGKSINRIVQEIIDSQG